MVREGGGEQRTHVQTPHVNFIVRCDLWCRLRYSYGIMMSIVSLPIFNENFRYIFNGKGSVKRCGSDSDLELRYVTNMSGQI